MTILLLGLILAAGPALAEPPATGGPRIVRGTVTALAPDTVTVTTKDRRTVRVGLSKDWSASVLRPIGVADIAPGSFIGTAEMPQEDGSGRSLEVHVFPPGVKMGEGHYNWDLKPGSMMTNGTVGKVVANKKSRELDVSYATGTRHIVVPPKVPIVQITPGAHTLVHPGVKVFLIASPTPAGGLITNSIAVGEHGVAPSM
ncbi:MAG: hypothetical protein JF588_18055 [Caulobacterales bacterium]|nr:hypothetical protein [Caulobacterales bacterium]